MADEFDLYNTFSVCICFFDEISIFFLFLDDSLLIFGRTISTIFGFIQYIMFCT